MPRFQAEKLAVRVLQMRKTTIKDISVIEDLLPCSSHYFAHQERYSEKPEDLILRDTSRSYCHKSPRKWERERERKVKHMISRIQIKVRNHSTWLLHQDHYKTSALFPPFLSLKNGVPHIY